MHKLIENAEVAYYCEFCASFRIMNRVETYNNIFNSLAQLDATHQHHPSSWIFRKSCFGHNEPWKCSPSVHVDKGAVGSDA